MNLGEIAQSKRWKILTGYAYNFGAAVVILGALFKLQHWSFSGPLLVTGLCTEAFIFIISAFEPPLEMPKWSKVYPQLKDDYMEDPAEARSVPNNISKLFNSDEVSPELISKLSESLSNLHKTASSMNDISSAALATGAYVKNMNLASETIGSMADMQKKANQEISQSVNSLVSAYGATSQKISAKGDELFNELAVVGSKLTDRLNQSGNKLISSYDKASSIIEQGFVGLERNSQHYGEGLLQLSKNMEALNSFYANQLKGTAQQMEASQRFLDEMNQMSRIIASSLDEIKKYQANALELNKNLEALNSIYGNMLGAMNYKKQ